MKPARLLLIAILALASCHPVLRQTVRKTTQWPNTASLKISLNPDRAIRKSSIAVLC